MWTRGVALYKVHIFCPKYLRVGGSEMGLHPGDFKEGTVTEFPWCMVMNTKNGHTWSRESLNHYPEEIG